MTWHAYQLVYQVKSPLHVGWRKMGNLMQTRPYISGRSWWGAATSLMAQKLGQYDYQRIGEFVRDNLVFGYFFLADEPSKPLLPQWKKGELCYATPSSDCALSSDEIERKFLNSLASTAIDHQSETAAEGQLHEVEFIAPKDSQGRDVHVVGHLFANDDQIACESATVRLNGVDLFAEALQAVQIGGERRYGFGQLQLAKGGGQPVGDVFGRPVIETGNWPMMKLEGKERRALPFHCIIDGLSAEGEVEPLVGREWDEAKGPGHKMSSAAICWTPGSVVQSDCDIEIGPFGIGRPASGSS